MVAGQFFTNDLTVICAVCCELQYTKDRGIDMFLYTRAIVFTYVLPEPCDLGTMLAN